MTIASSRRHGISTPMSLRADGDWPSPSAKHVMVTKTGHEVLTNFPRKLIVV